MKETHHSSHIYCLSNKILFSLKNACNLLSVQTMLVSVFFLFVFFRVVCKQPLKVKLFCGCAVMIKTFKTNVVAPDLWLQFCLIVFLSMLYVYGTQKWIINILSVQKVFIKKCIKFIQSIAKVLSGIKIWIMPWQILYLTLSHSVINFSLEHAPQPCWGKHCSSLLSPWTMFRCKSLFVAMFLGKIVSPFP